MYPFYESDPLCMKIDFADSVVVVVVVFSSGSSQNNVTKCVSDDAFDQHVPLISFLYSEVI